MLMSAGPELTRSRWYRSFYWRIGTIFVVMVVAVIVAQSVMFSMMWARSNRAAPERSPNNLATVVAADVGSALSQRPGADVASYIDERYGQAPWPMFVVMKDGRIAGNRSAPLSEEIRRSVEAALGGTDPGRSGSQPRLAGPVVTAPIVVRGRPKRAATRSRGSRARSIRWRRSSRHAPRRCRRRTGCGAACSRTSRTN
jgi:hypothetical protein